MRHNRSPEWRKVKGAQTAEQTMRRGETDYFTNRSVKYYSKTRNLSKQHYTNYNT